MLGIIKSGYQLKLKNFEGPLDLLNELIGASKLSITEIAISVVTDQYLHYLKTMQLFNIDLASEFFVVAATLVYMKTKKLLPNLKVEDDELNEGIDLLEKLKEYKLFRNAARILENMKENGDIYYPRGFLRNPFADTGSVALDEIYLGDLINVLRRYKGAFIKKAIPIKRREVKVEEKMELIMSLLKVKKILKFSELTKDDKSKIDTIASFVGSTELSFRQKVLLKQLQLFSDIDIQEREEVRLS
ncbi:MAG: segregation/condensation protein A [Brevinematales bacterium]|nr:segregation/condensation protein A [Brevinematales bacterium]